MTWLLGFTLLCAFAALGEIISVLLPFAFPGPIIGFVLLLIALELKWIKPSRVEGTADFLLHNLSLFFIPSGVGLMVSWPHIKDQAAPLLLITLVSTIAVLVVVGHSIQFLATRRDHR